MRTAFKKTARLVAALLIAPPFISGCATPVSDQPAAAFSSYLDVPGITSGEIEAIEAALSKRDYFVYGVTQSVEAFAGPSGYVSGFSALFCEWLSSFFGVRFVPTLYEFVDFWPKLADFEIDFSGDLTPTEERESVYFMTDRIAERPVKYFRI
ncbi:MAG: hypothetical protein FWF03_06180, partial [Defluviitaleaceae bacterium]|nr:hypothetical protein [Defluviitaleaceae bacterium]